MQTDFTASNQGSIILLTAITGRADDWLQRNCSPPDVPFGPSLPIEPRYFSEIACGLLRDGLTLQDADTGRLAHLPD